MKSFGVVLFLQVPIDKKKIRNIFSLKPQIKRAEEKNELFF